MENKQLDLPLDQDPNQLDLFDPLNSPTPSQMRKYFDLAQEVLHELKMEDQREWQKKHLHSNANPPVLCEGVRNGMRETEQQPHATSVNKRVRGMFRASDI